MQRWLAVALATMLSGCIGDDYYYLGPYSAPEPPQQTAGCGNLPRTPVETAPPPLVTNGPPRVTQTSSSSVANQTAEPALATSEGDAQTGWRRVFP